MRNFTKEWLNFKYNNYHHQKVLKVKYFETYKSG